MKISDILKAKGSDIYAVSSAERLDEAVRLMLHFNVGSLVVRLEEDAQQIVGIVTERGVLRAQACAAAARADLRVSSALTEPFIPVSPDASVELAMQLMTRHRVRHLPVMISGVLVGIVSIGDLLKAQCNELTKENHFMRSYIQGEGAERGTPV